MRITSIVPASAAAVALLAGAAAPAAVRGAPDDAEAAVYRASGYPACLSVNPLVARGGRVNENAIEECQCAIDRLIAGRDAFGLPALDEGNARSVLGPYLEECRGGKPAADKVPVAAAAPVERSDGEEPDGGGPDGEAEGDAAAEPPAPAVPAGEAKPEAPAWLAWTGLPVWSLWLLPAFALLAGLVLLTTRPRRGGRRDLTGPPPSLRGEAAEPRERE